MKSLNRSSDPGFTLLGDGSSLISPIAEEEGVDRNFHRQPNRPLPHSIFCHHRSGCFQSAPPLSSVKFGFSIRQPSQQPLLISDVVLLLSPAAPSINHARATASTQMNICNEFYLHRRSGRFIDEVD
ncbi:hypothetical protein CDL15_Pgr027218 [Punica granatum]|uniref:Uncharacterized protein n=1 Tax=Punica granatum TaxID=22663 RepID=A0A218WCC3_PUNGR|nr:hypothetical protein CDL15_Pgr027218 [Punica granatum]